MGGGQGVHSSFTGELDVSHLGHVLAMAPRSAYITYRKLKPHSEFQCNALRMHATVTVNLYKKLLEIPPSGGVPWDENRKKTLPYIDLPCRN